MRRETPQSQQHPSSCYGAGTRVDVHRSRYELEHVLNKYGANEVLFVEADANASIQFALHGHCVQLALPLPDPHDARFTHTPSGKQRTTSAQERAYDQALREHWRSLIVAVRGKLQSVESGISTFEQEFDRFLVPHFAGEEKKRDRKTPKAVNWLLGGSHTLAIALVAAFLVPASAVGAFALPTNVVGQLAAPFRSAVTETAAAGRDANGVALARGGWAPSHGNGSAPSADGGRLLVLRSGLFGHASGEVRQEAALRAPSLDEGTAPAPQPVPASNNTTPIPPSAPPAPWSPPAGGGGAPQPAHHDPPPADDTPAPPLPPEDSVDSSSTDTQSSDSGDQPGSPVSDPAADDTSSSGQPADGAADTSAPGAGGDAAPGNGNGNANGPNGTQGNGNANANGQNGTQGQGNAPGQSNAPGQGNGNGNGNANGQNGTQGQGNGQGNGQGAAQGNGKGGK
jgi:hypothetical protein